jgi:hypothetical protein
MSQRLSACTQTLTPWCNKDSPWAHRDYLHNWRKLDVNCLNRWPRSQIKRRDTGTLGRCRIYTRAVRRVGSGRKTSPDNANPRTSWRSSNVAWPGFRCSRLGWQQAHQPWKSAGRQGQPAGSTTAPYAAHCVVAVDDQYTDHRIHELHGRKMEQLPNAVLPSGLRPAGRYQHARQKLGRAHQRSWGDSGCKHRARGPAENTPEPQNR